MGLFSVLYGLGLSCKRFLSGNPEKLPAPVISIGNLTLGGTGKTPAVIAVAREAKKRGRNACILTRGYKGKAKDISFVSRGGQPLLGPVEAGDEACLMAETLRGVTIVKGKDRFRAGIAAIDNARLAIVNLHGPTLFVLDDGFQHWKLHRDVDVILVDGTNPFGNNKLFPEGILREPLAEMKRGHIMVITKADIAEKGAVTEITRTIRKYNQEAPIFNASHRPSGLVGASGNLREINSLHGRNIYAFSGIANPAHFQATLTSAGARIAAIRKFRDHHHYKQKDIDDIKKEAQDLDIITTEKDMVKLKELNIPENLSALRIEFSIDNDFYDTLFNLIDDS